MPLTAIQKIEKLGKSVSTMTQAELARAVGVSRERIRQLYPRLKTKPGRRVCAWHLTIPKSTRETLARLHDKGESLAEIGRRYGVSEYHVREAIRITRPVLEPAGKIKRLRCQEQIRRLLESGLSFEEACTRLKLSDLQRRRYRRQMGFRWEGTHTVPAKKKTRRRDR
uniref:RNA polymerase sigma-70 region 4 domain-containing protein n=1 Tax=candidate division WOR-3 bacterium TaxID=2052148 RepID=A0A7C4GHC1_UNCW3